MFMKRVQSFWKKYRYDILIVLAVLVVAAIPRLLDLGTYLTADEKNWIGRSFEFVRAFKDFRFNDMLQTTHPGVTAMWTIGAAVTAKTFLGNVPFSFRNLEHFVTAAQFPIALLNTLAVPAMYLLLRKIFSKSKEFAFFIPVVASLFIALDPFVIGYSRVAHVDALLMSFLFLAVLATIIYGSSGYQRKWLIISGVLSALALLTKAPAIFIVPFFVLVVLVRDRWSLFSAQVFPKRLKDFLIWMLLIIIIFLISWPALLWVPNPEGNVLVLKRDLVQATASPHDSNLGYAIEGGHYLSTLITRTSPFVLGLAVVTLAYLALYTFRRRRLSEESFPLVPVWLLVAYIFFFIVMMTLGAKKGDRYILPVWPALNVLAAFGVVIITPAVLKLFGGLKNSKYLTRKFMAGVLVIVVLLYLGVTVVRYHPYALSYSNPLFPDNLSQELGWGEGLEQVGAWLSVEAPNAVVASWYPEELGAFTSARVAHINAHEQGKIQYVVLYRNMFGRAPDHYANNFIDEYFKKREPVFTAMVAGKEFAWVYEKPVYERHVGELLPGVRIGQEVEINYDNFAGIELLIATFSGRADSGNLSVQLKTERGGSVIHSWQVPISELDDDRWLRLLLPDGVDKDIVSAFVEVSAVGASKENAPTVRYTRDNSYLDTGIYISTSGQIIQGDQKPGNMAVRNLFLVDGEFVHQDQTKLLDGS